MKLKSTRQIRQICGGFHSPEAFYTSIGECQFRSLVIIINYAIVLGDGIKMVDCMYTILLEDWKH